MTEEQLSVVKMALTCPSCHQKSYHTLSELVANTHVVCSLCGEIIEVEEHRASINEQAESTRKLIVFPTKRN